MSAQTIRMKQALSEAVKGGGSNLLTRDTGRAVLEKVEAEIKGRKLQGVVALDFAGIEVIDFSCADEVVAKLVGRANAGEYGEDFHLAFIHLNEGQREAIQVALERKTLAAMAWHKKTEGKGWESEILGDLNQSLRATLDLIMDGITTAREIAEKLKLELNAASTRLLGLANRRLVVREQVRLPEGGRQFIYKAVRLDL